MSVRLLLKSNATRVELVGQGHIFPLNFTIIAPESEASFLEELIIEELGTMRLNPEALYNFYH